MKLRQNLKFARFTHETLARNDYSQKNSPMRIFNFMVGLPKFKMDLQQENNLLRFALNYIVDIVSDEIENYKSKRNRVLQMAINSEAEVSISTK